MFKVTGKDEALPPSPLTILYYGEAGIGKTTLANTANNPIILDFDKGSHRASYRPDVLSIDRWSDIEYNKQDFYNTLSKYDTIIVDTVGNATDYIKSHNEDENPRLKNNQMQSFGALKNMFYDFHARLMQMSKDVIFIAHVRTKDEGDYKSVKPLVTGSSYDLILQKSDLVGYMSKINNQTILDFNSSEFKTAKNCAGYEPFVIGNLSEIKTFSADLISNTKNKLRAFSDAQKESLILLESLYSDINLCNDSASLNDMIHRLPKLKLSKAEKIQIWNYIVKHGTSINLSLNSNKEWE